MACLHGFSCFVLLAMSGWTMHAHARAHIFRSVTPEGRLDRGQRWQRESEGSAFSSFVLRQMHYITTSGENYHGLLAWIFLFAFAGNVAAARLLLAAAAMGQVLSLSVP
jgi:hypothetical protein